MNAPVSVAQLPRPFPTTSLGAAPVAAAPVLAAPVGSNNPFFNMLNTPQANLLPQYPLTNPSVPPFANSSGFMYRSKELKLNGQIGEPGEAGKLNYASLFFQISDAQKRGYSEVEIIGAVIKAITPNLTLRNYFERKRDLTLPMMLSSLRGHFLLHSAAKAYTALGNAVQKPGQKEVEYCHDVMGMRDDVLALSEEEGGLYSEQLVQSQMVHVLSVGFRKSSVRQEMRWFLKTPNLTDNQIIEQLREVVLHEKEHEEKTADTVTNTLTATAKTAAVTVNAVTEDMTDALLEQMQQLGKRMDNLANLSVEVDRLNQGLQQQQQSYPHVWNQPPGPVNGGAGNGGGGGFNGFPGPAGTRPVGAFVPRGGGGGSNFNGNGRPPYFGPGSACRKCGLFATTPGFWDHCFKCCGVGHKADECPKNS